MTQTHKNSSNTLTADSPSKPKKSWLIYGVSIIILCSVGVATYFAWQQWQNNNHYLLNEQQQLQQQLQQQASQFEAILKQQTQQLAKQSEGLHTLNNSMQAQQQLTQRRLQAQGARLNALGGHSRDSWVLEEARYLLRLANQRQLTGGNINGIINLLDAADQLLQELDKPALFTVRDNIHKEIISLKTTEVVDKEGIYLQLAALIKPMQSLSLAPLKIPQATPEKTVAASHWQDGLWQNITDLFSTLDDYVRIQQHDQTLQPVLSQTQQQLLTQRLGLLVETAQVALLKEESGVYQASLEQLKQSLNQHYAHHTKTSLLVEQIDALKQQKITHVLPELSASLEELTHVIEQPIINAVPQNKKETPATRPEDTVLINKEAAL